MSLGEAAGDYGKEQDNYENNADNLVLNEICILYVMLRLFIRHNLHLV